MTDPSTVSATRLRLYGVVFVAVLALLLSLSVAAYRKAFTDVVPVSLRTGELGNQLDPRADVKMRGLIVGEVREVHADGRQATLDLALDPEHTERIPADVSARLLPKTLFGEKYVELVVPDEVTGPHIRAGDAITQDRTEAGMELQQLMNDLYPLLRTVQPGKLNATLSAFATALEGRGEDVGDNLEKLEGYLAELNPHLPALQEDIARLADVADIYADAAPDLLRTLRHSVTTSRTLVEKKQALASVLSGTTRFAGTAQTFLTENEERLIRLGRVSRPTLALLARYSPAYPCLLRGLAESGPNLSEVFETGSMHITLEVTLPRPAYEPGEEPQYVDRSGPHCAGLPDPKVPYDPPVIQDGARNHHGGGHALPGSPVSATEAEQKVVGSLVAPVMGTPADDVPPVATLLFGPLARGTEVSVA